MRKEIDSRFAIGLIALILVLVGVFAWWKLKPNTGQQTAAAAGLGKPMLPGEIPGKTGPVTTQLNNGVPTNR